MIRRALVLFATAGLLLGVGGTRPAHAMRCDDSIEPACRIVFTVVCEVVAKGQPCVM